MKTWKLAQFDTDDGADFPTQRLDHRWDDDGDHPGHVTDPNHYSKIQIYGKDAPAIGAVIVAALNAHGKPIVKDCGYWDAFTATGWGLFARRPCWPAGAFLRTGQFPAWFGVSDTDAVNIGSFEMHAYDYEIYRSL
jgi:hypothetical protein